MTTNSTPRGFEVYRGPSRLDGSPIVAILTLKTKNGKTGQMAQLWILRADQSPVDAVRSGADAGICGDCVHRGSHGFSDRTCYVNVAQAPLQIWRSWQNSVYPAWNGYYPVMPGGFLGVRLGAYGDPAALPEHVIESVVRDADMWTGYTHQWRTSPHLSRFVMASVDSEAEALEARAAGWRYFRVTAPDATPMERETLCPSESVGLQCVKCGACNGAGSGRNGSIRITVHGTGSKRFAEATASATMPHSSR